MNTINNRSTQSDSSLRVVAAQCRATTGDTDSNIASMKSAVEKAVKMNGDVIVFPELFTSGYDAGKLLHEVAVPADGSVFQRVNELAKSNDIAICFGYPERDGKHVYNSVQLVDGSATALINHRKTHLYGDYEALWFRPGDNPRSSADFRGFKLSTLICYEIEFPELARENALSGSNVILVPTAIVDSSSPNNVTQLLVRARAAENNIYVVYVNHADSDGPMRFNGQSIIAGPLGVVCAASNGSEEELLYAAIDSGSIKNANTVLPYLTDLRTNLFAVN